MLCEGRGRGQVQQYALICDVVVQVGIGNQCVQVLVDSIGRLLVVRVEFNILAGTKSKRMQCFPKVYQHSGCMCGS